MKALIFHTQASLSFILGVFLVRALLQIVRANFRNPITQVITQYTNPLIMPLRKILPPIGKIDTATIVSCLFIALLMNSILVFLGAMPLSYFVSQPYGFLIAVILRIFLTVLNLFWLLILFSIILSFAQPNQHSPLTSVLHELTDPLLRPARKFIKPIGGLDLSPIPVLLILSALQYQFSNLI